MNSTAVKVTGSAGYQIECWYGRYSRRWVALVRPPSGNQFACGGLSEEDALAKAERLIAEDQAEQAQARGL